MAEKLLESHPLTPSEMGKKGSAIRWAKRDRGRKTGPKPYAQIRKSIAEALESIGLCAFEQHRGPADPEQYIAKEWAKRIPKEWEQLLDLAKKAGDYDLAIRALTAMTAMTRLNPTKLQGMLDGNVAALSSDGVPALSHLTDEQLAMLDPARAQGEGQKRLEAFTVAAQPRKVRKLTAAPVRQAVEAETQS